MFYKSCNKAAPGEKEQLLAHNSSSASQNKKKRTSQEVSPILSNY